MTSFYHPDYLATVAAEQAAPTTAAPQPPIDYGFNESQIARGIRSAVGATKAGLIGYGASAAELVGADETAQRWYAQALAEQQQAELDAPRVHSIRQVMESENPWGAGVDYAAGKVGEFLPYLALGAGAGMLGRAAGTAVGIGRGLRGTVEGHRVILGNPAMITGSANGNSTRSSVENDDSPMPRDASTRRGSTPSRPVTVFAMIGSASASS